jgi:hypothetical protein
MHGCISGIVYTIAIGIMVVAITAAASFTTQKMAKIFQYHPALGEPIFSHFISHIALLIWYLKYQQPVGTALRPQLDQTFILFLVL